MKEPTPPPSGVDDFALALCPCFISNYAAAEILISYFLLAAIRAAGYNVLSRRSNQLNKY